MTSLCYNTRASGTLWRPFLCLLLLITGAQPSFPAGKFYTYVGSLSHNSALLAWGTADGPGNTIGRDSASHGDAVVIVGGLRVEESNRNWVRLSGLTPDTSYPYEIQVKGTSIGKGQFRTWAEKASKLTFFVIGDFGRGDGNQYRLGQVMAEEFRKRSSTDNPVRFVLTTGDNLYGSSTMLLRLRETGANDRDWRTRFFEPYETVLKSIPFYPTLGNHDGNETENREDLTTYLDNFFFPEDGKHRFYRFSYGGLAEFFALDSTDNTSSGGGEPEYAEGGEQDRWLKQAMSVPAEVPWRIAYFHHPPFNAGPRHPPSRDTLKHLIQSLERGKVRVVFNGHEHNFQTSEDNAGTGGIQYVLSGAGGELRAGSVVHDMKAAHIAAWAAQYHFLVVEIDGRTMSITPRSFGDFRPVDPAGKPVRLPIEVKLR